MTNHYSVTTLLCDYMRGLEGSSLSLLWILGYTTAEVNRDCDDKLRSIPLSLMPILECASIWLLKKFHSDGNMMEDEVAECWGDIIRQPC